MYQFLKKYIPNLTLQTPNWTPYRNDPKIEQSQISDTGKLKGETGISKSLLPQGQKSNKLNQNSNESFRIQSK